MVNKAFAATTTQAPAVRAHSGRSLVGLTNTGSADEVVYISTEPVKASESAWIIYNRETIKLTGAYAQMMLYIESSANVTVNISEEF